ncbi:fungal-specific transcription factor domain-containing protein, partial [Thelonectria olida]
MTCRKRHRKCDEGKPACRVCQKSGRECEYGSDLKWAAVGHSRSFAASYSKKRRGTSRANKSRARSLNSNTTETLAPSIDRHDQPTLGGQLPITLSSEDFSASQVMDPMLDIWMPSFIGVSPWEGTFPDENPNPLIGAVPETGVQGETCAESGDLDIPEQTGELRDLVNGEPATSPGTGSTASRSLRAINCGMSPLISATLSSNSEEVAYTYYINIASARLPAYDGPQNPYRKLCLVSISYPLLLHTILYVSTMGMFIQGESTRESVTKHRSQAQSFLQQAVCYHQSEDAKKYHALVGQNRALSVLSLKEVTLAAHLMQIVTEVMSGSQAAASHLQSAYQLMFELNYLDSMPESFYARFLAERFAIIDVILAFLRRRKPIAPSSFVLYQQNEELDISEPAFHELTGCPQVVLTFLARVACLAHDAAAYRCDDSSHLAEAYKLETEMRIWGQRYAVAFTRSASRGAISTDQRFTPDSRECLGILGECFYWTAQLLLARRVFMDPTSSSRVQFLRRQLFSLMSRLPAGCGPDSSLPFPFYMAAREAMTAEDRDWVRQKHAEMIGVYRDRSRQIMMDLTEEIWTKADGAGVVPTLDLHPSLAVLENDMYIHVMDTVASHLVW